MQPSGIDLYLCHLHCLVLKTGGIVIRVGSIYRDNVPQLFSISRFQCITMAGIEKEEPVVEILTVEADKICKRFIKLSGIRVHDEVDRETVSFQGPLHRNHILPDAWELRPSCLIV